MKLKSLLVSLLAVSALVACNKENDGGAAAPTDGNGISVTVSIKSSGTRAVANDFTAETAITLTDVTVYFTNGVNGNIVDYAIFTTEQISAKSAVFHSINPSSTHAVIVANKGTLLTSVPATVADLNNTVLTMSDMQDLSTVPLKSVVGELITADASGHEAPEDGSEDDATIDYRTVSLDVVPVLARIEIGGTLTMTSTADEGKFAYTNFTPSYVGLNGLHENGTLGGAVSGSLIKANDNQTGFPVLSGTTTPSWMYNEFDATDKQNMINADGNAVALSKVYAYNVMPGETPDVLLRFASVALPADQLPEGIDPATPNAYIRIVNFTDESSAQITIEPGKIYTIKDITFDQDKVTWLDKTVLCVNVTVTVKPWEIVDVETPEFGE